MATPRTQWLALACLTAGALFPVAHAAPLCSKVVISGHPDYPPTTWYDGTRLRGGWHAIAARVFSDLGVPYEFSYQGPWARVLSAAQGGRIDFIGTLKINPERQQYLTFSSVAGTPAPITVFTRRDAGLKYSGKEDLMGKLGGRTRGEGYGGEVDSFVNNWLMTEEVASFEINLKKLELGRIAYVITGYYPGTSKLALLGLEDKVVPLKPNLSEDLNHFAFVTKSPCLKHLPAFDKRLAELLKDGTVAQLLSDGVEDWRGHTAKDGLRRFALRHSSKCRQ